MSTHICIGPDYRTTCLCARGQDHTEELFNVPVGEEEE